MLNCPWEKKYKADIERETALAISFNLPGKNWHEEAAQTARNKLHTLSLDHRMGGCICQAPRPGTWDDARHGIF